MFAPLRGAMPALLCALVIGTACFEPLAPDLTINRITLTPVTASIGVGATQQMTATARNRRGDRIPDVPFTFESLQPDVATISDSGLVTGIRTGTTTIRATSGSFVATATITVAIPECANAKVTTTITASQSINGELTTNDCVFTGIGHADGYRFVANAATTIVFTLSGATIRPKLSLTGNSASTVIAEAWSTTLGDTARLVASVNRGTYTLWVVENSADRGPYTLTARSTVACNPARFTTPIAINQTVSGALTDSSCLLPNNAEATAWSLNLAAESDVRLDVGARGFEPWVVITTSNLQLVSNSIPVGADSAVLNDRLSAGNYIVWVTSFTGGQGTFALTRSTAVFNLCGSASDTISVPGTINGTLAADDCVLEPGYLSDPIAMEVLVPTTLRIDLASNAFDALLSVADSNNTIIATNDDGVSGSTNSRIQATFPAGRYTLLPQAYERNSSGAYALSVALVAGIQEGIGEGSVHLFTRSSTATIGKPPLPSRPGFSPPRRAARTVRLW